MLLLVVAFVYAGPDRSAMLGEAFRGGEPVAATVARIDAWVTPPAYTGRAPIFLTGDAAQAGRAPNIRCRPAASSPSGPAAPAISSVVSSGHVGEVAGRRRRAPEAPPPPADRTSRSNARSSSTRASEVVVRKGDREVMAWRFAVEPDHAPQIGFAKPPAPTRSGALALTYSLKDDYGVVEAHAEIAPVDPAAASTEARPLFEAPVVPLSLPQLRDPRRASARPSATSPPTRGPAPR